jgi:membrane-associated phospholipid phosphatase
MISSRRLFAWIISAISHPLLVLTYGLILIIGFNPYLFGAADLYDELPLILICFAYTFLLPFISILFMKLIGLVASLDLQTREERIGPLIICIVFYTWFYINVYRNADVPIVVGVFTLGSVVALSISFLITVFSKISLHTVAWGGLLGLVVNLLWSFGYHTLPIFNWNIHSRVVLIVLVLISGLVASARLILSAHSSRDIYGGFLVGFTSQLIAIRFLL